MFFFVFHLNYFELTTFVDLQTPSLDILLVILNKSFAVQFFLCKLASVGQLSQTLSSLSTIQGLELIAEVRRSPSNELILSDSRNQLFRSNFKRISVISSSTSVLFNVFACVIIWKERKYWRISYAFQEVNVCLIIMS